MTPKSNLKLHKSNKYALNIFVALTDNSKLQLSL